MIHGAVLKGHDTWERRRWFKTPVVPRNVFMSRTPKIDRYSLQEPSPTPSRSTCITVQTPIWTVFLPPGPPIYNVKIKVNSTLESVQMIWFHLYTLKSYRPVKGSIWFQTYHLAGGPPSGNSLKDPLWGGPWTPLWGTTGLNQHTGCHTTSLKKYRKQKSLQARIVGLVTKLL